MCKVGAAAAGLRVRQAGTSGNGWRYHPSAGAGLAPWEEILSAIGNRYDWLLLENDQLQIYFSPPSVAFDIGRANYSEF